MIIYLLLLLTTTLPLYFMENKVSVPLTNGPTPDNFFRQTSLRGSTEWSTWLSPC